MRLATTTADFTTWGTDYEESVRLIHDAGFRYIDIGISKRICDSPEGLEEAKRLRDYAEKLDMKFIQAHSPEGNPLSLEKQDRLVELTNRSIEICKVLGVPQTVVHAGWKRDIGKEQYFAENLEFYKRLYPAMEKNGVNVLVENSSKKNLGEYYYFFTGQQMIEFLQYANHPLLHAVWDTGHGNTEGRQYEHLITLGKELYGVHIHDNSGNGDEHIMPYFGTLNMDDVMNGLIDAGYQGYFTFEAVAALRKSGSRHGKRHVFEKDMRLLEPTLEMQIDMERLMYTVGKHCLQSYGVFEK
jgi:sugar phosphate isomerase/epimerase